MVVSLGVVVGVLVVVGAVVDVSVVGSAVVVASKKTIWKYDTYGVIQNLSYLTCRISYYANRRFIIVVWFAGG